MKTVFHKADSRGHANHGWLNSYHTFSFANYHNPERMNFGVLRVLNDDTVAPKMGFGTHQHKNMEIVSIPLEGDLEHKDSMDNVSIIKEGDIQVMSAGTGIFHSEKNKNADTSVKFLQIWIIPNKENITPRYDQIKIGTSVNDFKQILSPNADDEGIWIQQNAWFSLGDFNKEVQTTYTLNDKNNGLYIFILEGEATINDQKLEKRDGLGLWDIENVEISTYPNSKVLIMEVPMTI
ncbi:MAG: hypothetical protein COA50_03550 [Flavobacteriaceae bacterium]|nr:MAG: hypothetical protein COA50_03550 [Flavobacteriaceae bacterium]